MSNDHPKQVLLLHGFTGTPNDLAPLAEELKRRGMRVELPLLAGHGTSANQLRTVSWQEWLGSAETALERLSGEGARIVVSLSMGTFIATILAAHPANRIEAVVLLSPAFALTWPGRFTTYVAHLRLFHFFPFFKKRGGSDIRDSKAREKSESYPEVPVASMLQFDALRKRAISLLPKVSCPAFIGFGKHDRTVNLKKAQRILKGLGSGQKEIHFFDNSGHVLPVDFDRQELRDKVANFIELIE